MITVSKFPPFSAGGLDGFLKPCILLLLNVGVGVREFPSPAFFATVAQSAEHSFRKAGVKGSTPLSGFSGVYPGGCSPGGMRFVGAVRIIVGISVNHVRTVLCGTRPFFVWELSVAGCQLSDGFQNLTTDNRKLTTFPQTALNKNSFLCILNHSVYYFTIY